MINKLKKTISNFTKSDKDVPLLAGFVSGLYPFLFYFSNNFTATNSIEHFTSFIFLFLILPMLFFGTTYFLFTKSTFLKPYRKHSLFVLTVLMTVILIYILSTLNLRLSFKKKLFVVFLFISGVVMTALLSLKYYNSYKKILVIIVLISVLPFSKLVLKLTEQLIDRNWVEQPDEIENVFFKNKPNIYLIQPDGYVGESIMKAPPYSYDNEMYNWLRAREFKLYDDFYSNYPATLISNSSMFYMKQHRYNDMMFPDIEMPNARCIVSGDNSVIKIFKRNGYKTFSLASDEYFQQNNSQSSYDYSNIDLDKIPLFSTGDMIKKDVYEDFTTIINEKIESPAFYFIEKLEPQHIGIQFANNRLKEERDYYITRIHKANAFLKKTINYIESKDPNGIIVVLADHGGFVGIEYYKEMYSNDNPVIVNSTFSVLAAIKWNGYLKDDYDKDLRSNVNLFRVLFSVLSQDSKYLNHLEDNGSYNLNYENPYYNSVYKVIDDKGNMLLKPLKTK